MHHASRCRTSIKHESFGKSACRYRSGAAAAPSLAAELAAPSGGGSMTMASPSVAVLPSSFTMLVRQRAVCSGAVLTSTTSMWAVMVSPAGITGQGSGHIGTGTWTCGETSRRRKLAAISVKERAPHLRADLHVQRSGGSATHPRRLASGT